MITDGVPTSWDGQNIRHCTLVSQPDEPSVEGVGNKMKVTENHLYGTFTLEKEIVVEAGGKLSAAMSRACTEHTVPVSAGIAGAESEKSASPIVSGKKTRRKPRKDEKRVRRKGAHVPVDDDGGTDVER